MDRFQCTAEDAYYDRVWEYGKLYEYRVALNGVEIVRIEQSGGRLMPYRCFTAEGKDFCVAPGTILVREVPGAYTNTNTTPADELMAMTAAKAAQARLARWADEADETWAARWAEAARRAPNAAQWAEAARRALGAGRPRKQVNESE